jgi:tol-pal system protein YbgF
MKTRTRKLPIFAALLALAASFVSPEPASAQLFGRSEQPAVDNSQLLLRLDRLENQVRNLNGQLEQMQFQLRRSEDQLKKFQGDVDFRLQELQPKGGARPATGAAQPPQRRSEIEPEMAPNNALAGGATPRVGRGDAFDPNASPDAPGAPRALGSLSSASTPPARVTPSGPLGAESEPNAPLDLMGRARRDNVAGLPAQPNVAPSLPTQPQASAAALPPTTPRDEFDVAFFTLERGQYDAAENGFKTFLQRYPKDALAGEATYFLGESFFKRGKHRDAAEQYLKISTDFPRTTHAPDAMLRLGQSLEKLGAKEQACAFYAEVPKKFPAATTIKASAQREAKRAQC